MDDDPALQAGAARVDLTPPPGVRLVGYLDRTVPAASVHDELSATALALRAGAGDALMLVCVDALALPAALAADLRALIARTCRVEERAVWLAPSHTHSGPPTECGAYGNDVEDDWVRRLRQGVVEAAGAAWSSLAPARMRAATCELDIGVNRRLLGDDGRVRMMAEALGRPVDRRAVALQLETVSGEPIACLVNVACHPVASGRATRYVSADYPGALRRELERAGAGLCAFTLGACGDVNPRGGIHEDPAHARGLGEVAATDILRALASAESVPVDAIRLAQRRVSLSYARPPDAPPPPVEHLTEVLECRPDELSELLDRRFPWASPLQQDDAVAVELLAARIGPIRLAAVPYELFAATGQRLAETLGPHAVLVTLANAAIGYLPPADELPRGGYEVDESFLLYRLPGPPPPTGEARVLAAFHELVEETA